MQLLFSNDPLYFQVNAFILGFTCSQVFHIPCGFCFFAYKRWYQKGLIAIYILEWVYLASYSCLLVVCGFILKCFIFNYLFDCTGSYCGTQDLRYSMWVLGPWSGIEPGSPALGVWSLSHWTIREVPVCGFWFYYPISSV